jgi:2'-5' RNA ligase
VRSSPDPLRLFVGVEVDEAARDLTARAVAHLQRAGIDGRFEPREKLHVTVAFLGTVAAERLPAVTGALDAVAVAPFAFPLEVIGAFPDLRRPRIVWLGSRRPQPAFRRCVAAVREALAPLGFRFERAPDARPHLTLARLRPRAAPLQISFDPAEPTLVTVDALTLFASLPDAGSTRYDIVHRRVFGTRMSRSRTR